MNKKMRNLVGTLSLGLAFGACGEEQLPVDDAQAAKEIEASLAQFDSNTVAFMNSRPAKLNAEGGVSLFDAANSAAALVAKNHKDFSLREDPDLKADAPAANDLAKNLVDQGASLTTKLKDMDTIRSAKLAESPWSDDYWALYAGATAKRYADSRITVSESWKANTDAVRNAPKDPLDVLSPAEKYDLLVGDANWSMTKYNLDTGKPYAGADGNGKVETWMGICHGWAPAAYMVPRPQKAITVTAADGKQIKFYPSDIKALASSLWANARASTRFIGGRCNLKDPAKDAATGRIIDTGCRDTNAGTWHLAVVNQIGRAKRSFVLDATYDYEVWNQPVYSYSYTYFNPITNKATSSLASAQVTKAAFTGDKFAKFRAPGTEFIVGVSMDVKWTVETRPSQANPDSPAKDAISGARYLYTLELDKDGNIVGGEWFQNAHPDFLWTPPANVKPPVVGDVANLTWDGKSALPANVRSAAASASGRGQPLPGLVDRLVALSRQ